ncbi:MAG: hypothetical protein LC745_08850 [Planctomycetia bacterium]|nr:hypothetical protein [Planctomycetia bacterium]
MRKSICCGMLMMMLQVAWIADPPRAGADDSEQGPIVMEVGKKKARAVYWLESSLKRVYPGSGPGKGELRLIAARDGKVSFQACVRNESVYPIGFDCNVAGADDLKPRVRLVGLVPLLHLTPNTAREEIEGADHAPGLVPDPLYPETRVLVGPGESRSFWITLDVPADAKPGERQFHARLTPWGGKDHTELPVTLGISRLVIQPRRDFHVIHWWRGEATWDYYKTGMFDERWWQLTRGQLENMLAHGSDVVYAPIFFDRRETFERPCQLLDVKEPKPGVYEFDWSRVKRFTDMARQIGFKKFEWSHIWIYWGVKNPVRIYKKQGDGYAMLWPPDTGATSETARRA